MCPMCLGKGYATDEDIKEYPHRCPNCNGKGFYSVDWQKVRCEVCNGSGKNPTTNEEWLKGTENTEQFASKICETFEISCDECKFFDVSSRTGCTFPSWLKEIHK